MVDENQDVTHVRNYVKQEMTKNLNLEEITQLKEQANVMKEHQRISQLVREASSSVRRTRLRIESQR